MLNTVLYSLHWYDSGATPKFILYYSCHSQPQENLHLLSLSVYVFDLGVSFKILSVYTKTLK